MKLKKLLVLPILTLCLLAMPILLTACGNNNGGENGGGGNTDPVAVSFTGLSANGTHTTTSLTLTFDKDPTALAIGNITVTGATKGILSGTGTTRNLTISDITVKNGENVTVTLTNPNGFTISNASRNVAITMQTQTKLAQMVMTFNAETQILSWLPIPNVRAIDSYEIFIDGANGTYETYDTSATSVNLTELYLPILADAGTATGYAKHENPSYDSDPAIITLDNSQAPTIDVESVTINADNNTINIHTPTTYTATVNPNHATNKEVTWAITSGSGIATLSTTTGTTTQLTATATGTVTITATAGGVTSTSKTITVIDQYASERQAFEQWENDIKPIIAQFSLSELLTETETITVTDIHAVDIGATDDGLTDRNLITIYLTYQVGSTKSMGYIVYNISRVLGANTQARLNNIGTKLEYDAIIDSNFTQINQSAPALIVALSESAFTMTHEIGFFSENMGGAGINPIVQYTSVITERTFNTYQVGGLIRAGGKYYVVDYTIKADETLSHSQSYNALNSGTGLVGVDKTYWTELKGVTEFLTYKSVLYPQG